MQIRQIKLIFSIQNFCNVGTFQYTKKWNKYGERGH